MKHLLKPLAVVAAVATSFALLSSTASAQTLVQWGSSDTIVNNFHSSIFGTGGSAVSTVDLGTSRNPNLASNSLGYYEGSSSPTGISATYYGAVHNTTNGTNGQQARLQITHGTPDALRILVQAGDGDNADRTAGGIALWQKSDGFLQSGTINWDDVDFAITGFVNAAGTNNEFRLVVRNDTTWYVSAHLGNFNTGIANRNTLSTKPTSWFSYNPVSDFMSIGTAATPTLVDITAIGYLYRGPASFTNLELSVSEFSATVIPEPSSALLLGLGGLALMALRRRRSA